MPRGGGMDDYAAEPNISFGRAIVVVVVLHIVAVGGICAFSSLKARNIAQQNTAAHTAKDAATAQPAPASDAGGEAPGSAVQSTAQENPPHANAATEVTTPVKPPIATALQEQHAKPPVNEATAAIKDSGASYTVAKGDTPVSIAKKLRVNYDDLLKLNKITDPKKLKIGQKLRVPAKKKPTSTNQTPLSDASHVA